MYIDSYGNATDDKMYNILFDHIIKNIPNKQFTAELTYTEYVSDILNLKKILYTPRFEYLLQVFNKMQYTQKHLEYAYSELNIACIFFLESHGLIPNTKCFEFICTNAHIEISVILAKEAINKKIFPNNQCMINAIDARNSNLVMLLCEFGCGITEGILEQIVSTNLFEHKFDLAMVGVEYDEKVYNLCTKYSIPIKTFASKFTFNDNLVKLHQSCATLDFTKTRTFVTKHELKLDQVCFDRSFESKRGNLNKSLIMLYVTQFNKKNNLKIILNEKLDKKTYDEIQKFSDKYVNICTFDINFSSLDLAAKYNKNIILVSDVLKQTYTKITTS